MGELDVKVIRGTAQDFTLPATPYKPSESTRKLLLWWGLYSVVLAGAWVFGSSMAHAPRTPASKAAIPLTPIERPKPAPAALQPQAVKPEPRPEIQTPAPAPAIAAPPPPAVVAPPAPPEPMAVPQPVTVPQAPRIEAPLPPPLPPREPQVLRAGKGAVKVKTTSTLVFTIAGTRQEVTLAGIKGSGGAAAREFQEFIDVYAPVQCEGGGPWVCSVDIDGQRVDLAAAALRNGAARTTSDASDAYRRQEAEAKAEKKGIWKK